MSTTTQRLARLTLTGTLCALTVLMTACGGGDGGAAAQVLRSASATAGSNADPQAEPVAGTASTEDTRSTPTPGTGALAEIGGGVETLALVPGVTLDTHPVSVDGSGKLLSWVTPQDHAFDRVSFLS
jgi:hypothetical protein